MTVPTVEEIAPPWLPDDVRAEKLARAEAQLVWLLNAVRQEGQLLAYDQANGTSRQQRQIASVA